MSGFIEANRELLDELGMLPGPLAVVESLREGILEERLTASLSGGFYYRIVRTAGGWQHEDTRCMGWLTRGTCRHLKGLNMTETALTTTGFALAVFDDAEDEEIVAALSGQVTRSWIYEFPMDGETKRGISAVGVEEASGEMAKHGEALRVMDVKIEYEDEKEARFLVQAGRYAISADGREALLDVTIRGKRQPKEETRRNGAVVFDKFWYEKGITKAARNAKLALMPEYAKTYILAEAVKAGRVRQVDGPNKARRPDAPQSRSKFSPNALAQPERSVDHETGEIHEAPPAEATDADATSLSTWWKATRELNFSRDVVNNMAKSLFGDEPMNLNEAQREKVLQQLMAEQTTSEAEAAQAGLPV